MYTPPHFASQDRARARRLIAEHPFAILVCPADPLAISHLPLLLDEGPGEGLMIGHVARANPHWRRFDGDTPAIAVFTGPHAYISPSWYRSSDVPTWNYAAVHLHGRPVALHDEARARDIVDRLVARFESAQTGHWSTTRLSDDRMRRQLRGIVAFEMAVERIETKFKMSQNRSAADIHGVVDALSASEREDDRGTATMMRALNRSK
jgi:transcriptional regulator